MGKLNYEEQRQSRIDRLEERAEKARTESEDKYGQAKQLGDMIPFGQPILIGHHSEKGHRRHLDKIDNNMRKSVEAGKKAQTLEYRAEAAKSNHAISSDDPEALDKLRAKLENLERFQYYMKAANKIVKSKKMGRVEQIEEIIKIGLKEQTAHELFEPDYAGRLGFPSFNLTNNNANIKRIKQRISNLEALATVPEQKIEIGEVTVHLDIPDNRVKVFFPDKPSYECRGELKRNGFRWSRYNGCWQAFINRWTWESGKEIATKYYGNEDQS